MFAENGIPLTRFAEMTSLAPSRILGRKAGLIRPGYPADFTVLDADAETVIHKDEMRSRSHNTPFDGWHVRGRVQTTIVEGEARYEYEKIG